MNHLFDRKIHATDGGAREFIISISSGWGQFHSSIDLIDLFITSMAFRLVKKNEAVLLVFILVVLKSINVLMFYLAADYTDQYSDALNKLIIIGLEIGWTVFDHVNTISSYHRARAFYVSPKGKLIPTVLVAFFLVLGVVLRLCRNSCRLGTCWVSDGVLLDTLIVVNNLAGEFAMLCCLAYKCLEYRNMVKDAVFQVLYTESIFRMLILLPLGIIEALFFYLQSFNVTGQPVRASLLWLTQAGTIARHLSGTILIILIFATKMTIAEAREDSRNNPKTQPITKPSVAQSKVE